MAGGRRAPSCALRLAPDPSHHRAYLANVGSTVLDAGQRTALRYLRQRRLEPRTPPS